MPLIWNNQLEAYAETAPLPLYDPAIEAYRDTKGLLWDNELEAWREVWPSRPEVLHLYNQGDECTDITGGWRAYPYQLSGWGGALAPTLIKGSSSMDASLSGAYTGAVATVRAIPMDGYSKLYALVSSATQMHTGTSLCTAPVTSGEASETGCTTIATHGETVTDKEICIDISQISGTQHVIFRLVSSCNITIKQVWLE